MKYKKTVFSVLCVSFLVVLVGCGLPKKEVVVYDTKPRVAATIFPLYDIVKKVGGEKINVTLLLSPGASPHTFEPTPAMIRDTKGITHVFTIGLGVDNWAESLVQAIGGAESVDLSHVVPLLPFGEDDHDDHASHDDHGDHDDHASHDDHDDHTSHDDHDDHTSHDDHDDHDGHAHGEYDPHYWLDPNNATLLANAIAEELSEINPKEREYYMAQSAAFAKEINEKNIVWEKKLESLSSRDILTFHDGWQYFARHFNLHIVGTFEPFPGKSPSPKAFAQLHNVVKTHNIQSVFIEPQLAQSAVESFAKDAGLTVFILDPLGGELSKKTYSELIDYNVQQIYNALQ